MTFTQLENTIRKYMLLSDPGIIRLLCAFVVAVRLPIPPPWLFILGASSGGKSMLLNSLAEVRGFYSLDNISSSGFISGMKSAYGENSLLFELQNSKDNFLVFKDFTTILSKQKEQRAEIVGLLRKIYDGELSRKTGNMQGTQNWEGKIGVLGGSTSSFYTKMGDFADMGERTMMYIFQQPDKRLLGERIFEEGLNDFEAKSEMRRGFKEYLDNSFIEIPKDRKNFPQFDPKSKEDLLDLAELTTTARSGTDREEYDRDKPIKGKHFEEQIGRFLKELMAVSYGLMILNRHDKLGDSLTPNDKNILYHIALDTIPINRRTIMTLLVRMGGRATQKQIVNQVGLGNRAVRIALEDMHAHNILNVEMGLNTEFWDLKTKWYEIMRKFEYMDTSTLKVEQEDGDFTAF